MVIRNANNKDLDTLSVYDKHIAQDELKHIISINRLYVIEENNEIVGWLRYNLFWDNTPFMNMLYILKGYRRKGYGKKLVKYWENDMESLKYKYVMTSTASDEYAQHFYVKQGYRAIGGFTLPGDPFEIIFIKQIIDTIT